MALKQRLHESFSAVTSSFIVAGGRHQSQALLSQILEMIENIRRIGYISI